MCDARAVRKAGDAIRLLRHARPWSVGLLVLAEAGGAAVPLAVIAVIGALVGRVGAHGSIGAPLAVLSLLLLLQQVLGPMRAAVAYQVTRSVDGFVRGEVVGLANGSLSIAPLEDARTLDLVELAGGVVDPYWGASPGGAAVGVVALAGRYVQVAGATVLLSRLSVPVGLGLGSVVLVAYRKSREWNRVRLRAIRENQLGGRASRYTSGLANTPPTAKEVRLFGALDWLEDRFRAQWDDVVAARLVPWRWASTRIASLVVALGPVIALALVEIARIGTGPRVSSRTLAVALQAAVSLFTLLFDQRQDDAYQVDFGLEGLDALRTLQRTMPGRVADATLDPEGLPRQEIRFEGVGFAYPGSGRPVFAGLDLTIAAGTSLAIVGGNGAGKTTLVKILARLHEPQTGEIRIDGIRLDEIDPVAWRRRMAVIFQDFVHYELAAADNVGFGAVGRSGDRGALERAAARAGALELVGGLPAGWATPLNRQYTGGVDLSGGQWQRVALARALFAVEAGAGILVLDEPSANLDVRAEAALFEDFLELTHGLTTILISHRFSTVRHADRICVLDGGRVVEDGTHAQLVAADGRYAKLFRLQAARFRD
jgi:ATP-binding cassette subfamily B protein